MQKKLISILLFFGIISSLQAQKLYDLWPYGNVTTNPIKVTSYFKVLANNDTSIATTSKANFLTTVASICDSSGQMLFYTNGISIFNAQHEIIPNGDSINFGNLWNSFKLDGYLAPQSIQIIPVPNKIGEYYMIHQIVDFDVNDIFPKQLDYTVIKLDENKKPKVSEKNIVVYENFHEFFSLVKHGNGVDYWLFVPDALTNTYQYFLVDSSGVNFSHTQIIDNSKFIDCSTYASPAVSPDGKYYLRFHHGCNLAIYNFDRWNGVLKDEQIIKFDTILSYGTGSAFSKSSKIAYISSDNSIYQIDLNKKPLTLFEVAHKGTYPGALRFAMMDLASNGKIYINSSGPFDRMHVIDQPDSLGIKCNVIKEGVKLTGGINLTMPRTPNPFLGKLDTITNTVFKIPEESGFIIYPNPTNGSFNLKLNLNYEYSDLEISIVNVFGKNIYESRLMVDKTIRLDSLEKGLYIVLLKNNNKILGRQKLIISN